MEDKTKKPKKSIKSEKKINQLAIQSEKQSANEKIINKITLECLMNDALYEKYVNKNFKKQKEDDRELLEDLGFYSKRITNLTRELLKVATDPDYKSQYRDEKYNYLRDIISVYSQSLIEHFKHEDMKDIIQEQINKADLTPTNPNSTSSNPELKINPGNLKTILESDLENLMENIDKNLAQQKADKYNWDKFVVKRVQADISNPANNIILPHITEIDLKNPELKTKGLREKKKKPLSHE